MVGSPLQGVIMIEDVNEDGREYTVLVNAEEQYSLWVKNKTIPAGWRAVGKEGTKAECLKYVDEVWTDMRPLSLRKKMAATQ
jgi:MbtH protein